MSPKSSHEIQINLIYFIFFSGLSLDVDKPGQPMAVI